MSWFRSRVSKPGDLYCRALRIPWRFPFLCSKFPWREGVGRWYGRLPFEMESIVDLVGSVWPLRRRRRHREGSPGVELRSEAGSSAFGSRHHRSSSIDRSLLTVADQHVAARGRELCTIFLEASQNSKIALIHQLAAEMLHVARACLLLLVCAGMSKGAGRSWDTQQGECQEEFVHGVISFRLRWLQRPWRGKLCHSITIAWSFSADAGALRSSRMSGMAASERIIINLKSSI